MDAWNWILANKEATAGGLVIAAIAWQFRAAIASKLGGVVSNTATDQAAFDAAFTLRAYFTKTKSDAGMEATKGVLVALCNERPLPQAPPQVPPT